MFWNILLQLRIASSSLDSWGWTWTLILWCIIFSLSIHLLVDISLVWYLGYCEWCCTQHWCAIISVLCWLRIFQAYTQKWFDLMEILFLVVWCTLMLILIVAVKMFLFFWMLAVICYFLGDNHSDWCKMES